MDLVAHAVFYSNSISYFISFTSAGSGVSLRNHKPFNLLHDARCMPCLGPFGFILEIFLLNSRCRALKRWWLLNSLFCTLVIPLGKTGGNGSDRSGDKKKKKMLSTKALFRDGCDTKHIKLSELFWMKSICPCSHGLISNQRLFACIRVGCHVCKKSFHNKRKSGQLYIATKSRDT